MGYTEDELSQIVQDIDQIAPIPSFNQTAVPRGLTAQGTPGQEVNVPLPEPRIRNSDGK